MNVKSYTDGYYQFYTMEIDHLKKESDMLVDAINEVNGFLSQPDVRDVFPPCVITQFEEHKKKLMQRHEEVRVTRQITSTFVHALRVIDQHAPQK